MLVGTWNVNSVRARMPRIVDFCEKQQPDVLCMQETKVTDEDFPADDLREIGYEVEFSGEKSYNGVAVASRLPMEVLTRGFDDGGEPEDASRLLIVEVQPTPDSPRTPVPLVNTYVPQGKDPEHEAFRYKLDWLQRLRALFDRHWTPRKRLLWVGDMNVAPEPIDIWEPERHEGHPDYHPDARAAFAHTADWGFVDCFRKHHPEAVEYTFYDYRDPRAIEAGHGWRVDHIMATKPLASLCTECWIDLEPRTLEKPSDHAPMLARFEF